MPHRNILIVVAILVSALFIWYFAGRWERGGSIGLISAEREMILNKPEEGEKESYLRTVERAAVRADVLELGAGCSMNPLVLELSANETLTIQNNDSVTHTVSFEDNSFFSVSAGRSRTLDLMKTFGKGEGVYRYKCNDLSLGDNVGVLYITRAR